MVGIAGLPGPLARGPNTARGPHMSRGPQRARFRASWPQRSRGVVPYKRRSGGEVLRHRARQSYQHLGGAHRAQRLLDRGQHIGAAGRALPVPFLVALLYCMVLRCPGGARAPSPRRQLRLEPQLRGPPRARRSLRGGDTGAADVHAGAADHTDDGQYMSLL